MQVPVLSLGCVLLAGAASLTLADYSHMLPESSVGARLGSIYLLNDRDSVDDIRSRIDKVGFQTAGKVFRAALCRNSASADLWSDVGEALLSGGNQALADYCYVRAGQLAPSDIQILLNIGDFYSKIGNSSRAAAAFSNILRQSNDSAEKILRHNIFAYYENMGVRQKRMLGDALPNAASAADYVRYLMEEAEPGAVLEVWRWSHQKGFGSDRLTIDCVNYLLDRQQYEAASQAWNGRFTEREGSGPKSSVVFNGGFEHEFLSTKLDWHFDGLKGVAVSRDSATFDEGRFSMRIDFTGNDNPDFRHVSQVVFLGPGRYRFEAHVRTDSITSDQGVRFSIRGAINHALLAETEPLTGTNGWQLAAATVDIPTGIAMAEVAVVRHRSIRIDNQLTGTEWIDAVTLTRLN